MNDANDSAVLHYFMILFSAGVCCLSMISLPSGAAAELPPCCFVPAATQSFCGGHQLSDAMSAISPASLRLGASLSHCLA
eukprot:6191941-Pleurochrysis_carterae.AAC.1